MDNSNNSNVLTKELWPFDLCREEDYYFDGYSRLGIHEEMLKDRIRTRAYMLAMQQNPELFRDKVVLDVGSGTGILSIFAAKSGAKHVYAVQKASIYIHSRNVIAQNHLSHKITVINGLIEEIELQVDEVDVIISEWMGYFLLYQSMLDSVIFARDKWLKSEGILLPNHAKMYIAALDDTHHRQYRTSFWDSVYGVSMKCLKVFANSEPFVDSIPPETIISNAIKFYDIDLKTVKVADLDFRIHFQLKIQHQGLMNGLVAWFDCDFNHGKNKMVLSTSPYKEYTHWKHTIFYMNCPLQVKKEDNLVVKMGVSKIPQHPRELKIVIAQSLNGGKQEHFRYRMG